MSGSQFVCFCGEPGAMAEVCFSRGGAQCRGDVARGLSLLIPVCVDSLECLADLPALIRLHRAGLLTDLFTFTQDSAERNRFSFLRPLVYRVPNMKSVFVVKH